MWKLRNLTVTVREDVARWARLRAAHENKSISRLVGEMLAEKMSDEEGYEVAKKAFLARRPGRISSRGPYPTREEAHERRVR